MKSATTKKPTIDELREIKQVVALAKNGNESAVPRLREMLDRFPVLWERSGDIAREADAAWVTLIAGPNLHMRESLMRYLQQMRADLTRPAAEFAERLLVDRVVACWLQMQYFFAIEANAISAGETPKVSTFRAKRQEQAQRMYQTSVACLITMQKLLPHHKTGSTTPTAPELLPDEKSSFYHNRIEAYLDEAACKAGNQFAGIG